jgi:ATP-dependent RNA circularization protein (DNA/RNA ligase family)
MQYPKIHSLWKRQGWYLEEGKKNNPEYQKGRQSFIIGDYALPEFGIIKQWRVSEKVDGTNIRIHLTDKVEFHGRTADSNLPTKLYHYLSNEFTYEKLDKILTSDTTGRNIWLFGEGYGAGIQSCGGNYRKDMGFILFDIFVNGWWLGQDNVQEIASQLNISYVPTLGLMTESEIIEYVKSKPLSLCSEDKQIMEGIVARTEPVLVRRSGEPLMMKLKCKEF